MISDPLFEARKEQLYFYSPFNFLRSVGSAQQLSFVREEMERVNVPVTDIDIKGSRYSFYTNYLDWDTTFFKLKTYRLYTVLYSGCDYDKLVAACKAYLKELQNGHKAEYCFIEVPSEDIMLIQALCMAGFKLSETRLTYFNDNISSFEAKQRYGVRKGSKNDIENLRLVASDMRNDYDRFHADPAISVELADSFLSKYIEEALKGFSDVVLLPDEPFIPADSFLTANYLEKYWKRLGVNVSKMVLSAVSSATNKGWYEKLISEMTLHLKENGATVAFMNTQSTNRAVFRVWEKLGYRLGFSTHVLTATCAV